jgi:hypothetical protein
MRPSRALRSSSPATVPTPTVQSPPRTRIVSSAGADRTSDATWPARSMTVLAFAALELSGVWPPSKWARLPAEVNSDAHRFELLAQARVEQRAWTILLTGRIRAGARGSRYERDRPHPPPSSPWPGSAVVVPAGAGRRVLRDSRPHQRLQKLGRQLATVWKLDEALARLVSGGLDCGLLGGEERRREPQ